MGVRATAESPNIRITARSKAMLRDLAKREGRPMQAVLDAAIQKYERDKFLDAANEAFAALRKSPAEWRKEQAERAIWDKALADGLDDE